MIANIKNKILNIWQSRRYRQIWQDHKVCVIVIAVLALALIVK